MVADTTGFGTFDLSLTTLQEQENDECSAASEVSIDGSPIVGTIPFTIDPLGPLGVCVDSVVSVANYGLAWYRLDAVQDAALRASTCAGSTIGWAMSSITIASGDCYDALLCVRQSDIAAQYETCNEGSTFVDFQVEAGTSYYIAVWGSGYSDLGLLELEIRSLNPPNNDNCDNTQRINVNANLTAAFNDVTLSTDESDQMCLDHMSLSNSGGIWYSFIGTGEVVTATACSNDFSPYLSIYSGSCGALECISRATWETPSKCSSYRYGQLSLPIATEEGTLYYLLVSGSGPITGNFALSLRAVPPVENDSCFEAIQIEANGELVIGNLEGGIYEDFYDPCPQSSGFPWAWYVVVGNGGTLKADTCSQVTNFDTMISVYRENCTNLECVGTNVDGCESLGSSLNWSTKEGERYYVRVGTMGNGEVADFGLKVAPFVPAVNDGCDGAINLPIGGEIAGTMDGATGRNESTSCFGSYDTPALWYYVDGTGTALQVSTCSSVSIFNGGIQAFEGTSCSDLQCVGVTYEGPRYSDNDCPSTWFFAEEGLRYFVLLIDDSRGGANNTFSLTATEFELAANDVCETALPIAVGTPDLPVVVGSTTNALGDNVTCDYYDSLNAPGVWYSVIGTGNTLVASTCSSVLNFDSGIYVFTGKCGTLECVAFGRSGFSACGDLFDGGSKARFRTDVGVEYFILVTGSNASAAGDFALSLFNTVPPPNNVCSDAIAITPDSGRVTGSLTNATKFFGLDSACAYDPTALSIWYSVIGTGEILAISTCSRRLNFDSAISVSSGSCGNHVCITYNANNIVYCEGTTHPVVSLTLRTEIGVEYLIAVEALNFPSQADCDLTVSTVQVPVNDECQGATVIQPDTGPIAGSITNATGFFDINSTCCGNIYDAPDVWYSMIGTGDVYAVSTCSSALNFDTSIGVSKGSCDRQERIVYNTYGFNDCTESSYSAARAVYRTEVGVEYFIVVEGVNYPSEGEFTLELSRVEVPSNDVCSGAIRLQPGDNMTIRGSLANATGTMGLNISCVYSSEVASVWFVLNGTGDVYAISTCSSELTFDSALSVSSGSCNNQTCMANSAYSNYDCTETSFASSEIIFRTLVGVEYFIHVQSLSASSQGDFALRLSTVEAPANDACTGALTIGPDTEKVIGSITNATGPDSVNSLCSFSFNSPDVWYSLVGTGDVYSVSTCSIILNFESALSVFYGSCSSQVCVIYGAFNDETCQDGTFSAARVIFPTQVGVEYFISVQGINNPSVGEFELQISRVELPANDICSGAVILVPGDGPIEGSTEMATYSGGTNSSCSGFDTSPDLWYRVEGTGASLTASTCDGGTDYDSQISIFEGTGEDCDTKCIFTNDDSCGSGSKVTWMAKDGVTYYIRVHGYHTSSGSFVLSVD